MSDQVQANRCASAVTKPQTISLSLAAIGFGVLTAVEFAGTRPFNLSHIPQAGLESKGTAFEALVYLLSTTVCIVVGSVNLRARQIDAPFVGLLIMMTYCGVTLLWSDAFFQGAVRYIQFALVSLSVALVTNALGAENIVRITYRVLVILLVVNLLSVYLIEDAMHGTSDYDGYQSLIGSWRGVHIHKNYAGAVAAVTCLMASSFILSGRWMHILVLVPAGVFLVESNSKTSLFLAICLLALLCLIKGLCAFFGRFPAKYLLVFLIFIMSAVIMAELDRMWFFLEDPSALTGRVELWNALGRYIEAYPLSGSGFGSFWRLGWETPILHLVDGWSARTGQGHNGYLDAAVTLGIPGLTLALAVFVVVPGIMLIQQLQGNALYYDIFFCLILFGLGHNMLESSLFSGNHPIYFALLIGIFGLSSYKKRADSGGDSFGK